MLHFDLVRVAESVEALDREHISINGVFHKLGPVSSDTDRYLGVADVLYRELYLRPPAAGGSSFSSRSEISDFQSALLASNTCSRTRQTNWTIKSFYKDGRVEVEKDGVAFLASTQEIRPYGNNAVGSKVEVLVPSSYLNVVPGFILFLGARDLAGDAAVARLYWHLTAASAPAFISAVTDKLNFDAVPFKAKVVSHPDKFMRADAGVVYLGKATLPRAERSIADIYRAIGHDLRSTTPLFTKALAPGLAVADDPGPGVSFGQSICRLLAKACVRAFDHLGGDRGARLRAIAYEFEVAQLDPTRPHLAPRADDYTIAIVESPGRLGAPALLQGGLVEEQSRECDFLAAATAIGTEIAKNAVWSSEGLCNWIDRRNVKQTSQEAHQTAYGPLSFDLYSGLSGVALFLTELFQQTGDPATLRTAEGALRAALMQVRSSLRDGEPCQLGFFTGLVGLAHVAVRLKQVSSQCALLVAISELLFAQLRGGRMKSQDVIDGSAGVVLGLLQLRRSLDDEELPLECAIILGKEIAASLREAKAKSGDAGFAHGRAGMGLALLELYRATNDSRFLQASRDAFGLDEGFADALQKPAWQTRGSAQETSTVGWCRGSPGIGLAHALASKIDVEFSTTHIELADIALDAAAGRLQRHLASPSFDCTLCHGAAGLIEILYASAIELDKPVAILDATRFACLFAEKEGIWRSGFLSGAKNTSLMLGTSGVGLLFLRLNSPLETPSILSLSAGPST